MASKAQVKVAFFSAHGRRSHTTPRPFGMGQVHGSLCQWTGPLHSKQSSSTQGSIIYMDHSDIFPPRSRSVLLDFHKLTATYPSTSILPYVTPTAPPPPPPPPHTHTPPFFLLLACCFTSTETIGSLRAGSSGRPPAFHTALQLCPLALFAAPTQVCEKQNLMDSTGAGKHASIMSMQWSLTVGDMA